MYVYTGHCYDNGYNYTLDTSVITPTMAGLKGSLGSKIPYTSDHLDPELASVLLVILELASSK